MNLPKLAFHFGLVTFLFVTPPALAQSSGTPTALFKASEAGNAVEIRKALASGIAVDAPDPDGWTALMVAASAGKLQAAQLLVKSGADVNAVSKKGETPLMAAVLSGSIAMVKFLLSEGADKTAATTQGLTAADIAERSKKPEIARLLRPAGSKTNTAAAPPSVSTKQMEQKVSAAAAAFQAGNFEEAAKRFQEIVTLDPAHALAWHFLGQSLDKTGKKEEARSAFKKSLELQPTGSLAERNEKMLAQIRRGPPPTLPPEVPAGTREIVMKNPLFVSLPDSVGLRCRIQQHIQGSSFTLESTTIREFQAGTSGVMPSSYKSTSQFSNQAPTTYEDSGIATLGGRIQIAGKKGNAMQVELAEGTLFPLKTGNRYHMNSRMELTGAGTPSTTQWDQNCEVLERVDVKALKIPLGADDAFRVRCNVEWVNSATSSGPTRNTSYTLCSQSLGLCPLYWSAEAGEGVPNFAGGFSYKQGRTGNPVTETQSCERLP